MANEVSVRVGVRVRRRSGADVLVDERFDLNYRSDMDGVGPSPGSIAVPEAGVNVDFSQLASLGECGLKNSGAFPILWGVADATLARFIPIGQMAPGKGAWLGQLYEFFGEYEEHATGTGSVVEAYALHLRAVGGASSAFVGAYES